jgi:aquaporin rerated protein, other eukaryote
MAIPSNLCTDLLAAALEFIGTTFVLLGLSGIQSASYSAQSSAPESPVDQVHVIATAMGLSLLASAWLFYRVTGALFNPNVTHALFLVGPISLLRFILYCVAELMGYCCQRVDLGTYSWAVSVEVRVCGFTVVYAY